MWDQTMSLEELFKQLLPENRREVRSYIEFLITKREARSRRQPQFDWAGALSDLREQYSSVELQHQIRDLQSKG
jgi:hypothetical protein